MNPEDNEFLKIDNPFENVKHAQDEMVKAQMEFQRLCYEVFHVEPNGKKLMELLKERYLLRPLYTPDHPQAVTQSMFWEGFREAIRSFHNYGLQHIQYINGVTNNGTGSPTTS
jgi:hypothetical protein